MYTHNNELPIQSARENNEFKRHHSARYYAHRVKESLTTRVSKLICAIFLALLFLTGLIFFILWLSLRPHRPRFHIHDVSIQENTINYDVNARNSNQAIGIYYDTLEVTVKFDGQNVLGSSIVFPFYQEPKNTTVLAGTLSGATESWQKVLDAKSRGSIAIQLDVTSSIRFKVSSWTSKRHRMHANCPVRVGSDGLILAADKEKRCPVYFGNILVTLLLDRCATTEQEFTILSKLKMEFGCVFTSMMERMVKDMKSAKKLQGIFQEYLNRYPNLNPTFDFSVTLLNNNSWPSYKTLPLNLPTEMDIKSQLNLSEENDVAQLVNSLSSKKGKVLIFNKELDIYEVNSEFTSKKRRIMLLAPPCEKKKAIDVVDINRRCQIDATIVRIMKTMRVIQYTELCTECVQHLRMFKPDVKIVKRRIESLIEREFLLRAKDDKSILEYLS